MTSPENRDMEASHLVRECLELSLSDGEIEQVMAVANDKFGTNADTLGTLLEALAEIVQARYVKALPPPPELETPVGITGTRYMITMQCSFVLGTLYGYQKGILED